LQFFSRYFLTQSSKSKAPVFVREATGLVRELNWLEAATTSWTGLSIPFSLVPLFLYSFLFPGAELSTTMLVALLGFAPLALIYAMMVAAMPRSGGDYVFVSRTLHPVIALAVVTTLCGWFVFWSGAYGIWIFTLGLSPAFSVIGSITNAPNLVALSSTLTDPFVTAVGALIATAVFAALSIVSTKWTFRVLAVMVATSLVSIAAITVILFAATNQQFQAAFNAYSASYSNSTNYYQTILSNAQKAGFAQPTGFGLWDTILFIPFGSTLFMYISNIQAFGGEIKRATRTSYYACISTLIINGLLCILISLGWEKTITMGFANLVTYDYVNGAGYVLPVYPSYNFLASLLVSHSIVGLFLVNVGFVTMGIAILCLYFVFVPRYLLAGAFDRLFPQRFADVNERFHTPHVSVLFSMVLALIFIPFFAYWGSVLSVVSAVLGQMIFGYLLVAIAAIAFPFMKNTKAMYQASPINKSVGGIPVITILGIISSAFMAWNGFYMLTDSRYGVNSTISLTAVVLVAAIAPIWYFARNYYLKTKGIDLAMVYHMIPPE